MVDEGSLLISKCPVCGSIYAAMEKYNEDTSCFCLNCSVVCEYETTLRYWFINGTRTIKDFNWRNKPRLEFITKSEFVDYYWTEEDTKGDDSISEEFMFENITSAIKACNDRNADSDYDIECNYKETT